MKELQVIALLRQAADPGHEEGAKWAAMRVHLLTSPIMTNLGYSSKLNAEWAFLTMLKEEGRRTVDKFLKNNGNDLGQRSTLNLNVLLEQILKVATRSASSSCVPMIIAPQCASAHILSGAVTNRKAFCDPETHASFRDDRGLPQDCVATDPDVAHSALAFATGSHGCGSQPKTLRPP